MKKNSSDRLKSFGFKKSLKKLKGFYIALAICLLAIGGVLITTLNGNLDKTPSIIEDEVKVTAPPTIGEPERSRPVDNLVTDIPDERPKTTAPPKTTEPEIQDVVTPPKELFILPLSKTVTQKFSKGNLVFSPTMGDWRAHNGVDFKGEEGSEVRAVADGTIKAIEEDAIWGKTITIDHGFGIVTRYAGVTPHNLSVDKVVEVGDILGHLSSIPCENDGGFHLHLEVKVNGEYVDPIEAIGAEVEYSE